MKRIVLSSRELRRWRENQAALVDAETGDFVRYLTQEESDRAALAQKRGADVQFLQDDRPLKLTGDRDLMSLEFSAQHGSCVIRYPNGQIARVLREGTGQVKPYSVNQVLLGAPDPGKCICAQWEGRHPLKHHRRCQFNALAPMHQQDTTQEMVVIGQSNKPEFSIKPSVFSEVRKPPVKSEVSGIRVPSPEQCECQSWEGREDGEHHYTCNYHDAWKVKKKGLGKVPVLCTMRGESVRPATSEEIDAARQAYEVHDIPAVMVDGQEYLVANLL